MSSMQNTIQTLRNAFPSFLTSLEEKKPLTDVEEKAVKLFSENLKGLLQNPHLASIHVQLEYIQKRWSRICQELCQPTSHISSEFFKRVDKVHQKLNDLTPNDAELIIDLLEDPSIKESLRVKRADQSRILQFGAPKAFDHAQAMVKRILCGLYGQALRASLFDLIKNPLLVKERFIRMLYIDLHLRKLDPREACEWFRKSSIPDSNAIRNCLWDQQVALTCKTALPDREIHAIMMDKGFKLPKEVEEKFGSLLKNAGFVATLHSYLLDHVRPYFAPSQEDLLFIANRLSQLGDFARAMQIGLRLDDHNFIKIFANIASKNVTAALELIGPLKRKKPALYMQCLEKIISSMACKPKQEDLANFSSLLQAFAKDPKFSTKVEHIIIHLSEKPLSETSTAYLMAIFSHISTSQERLNLLEICFKKMMDVIRFEESLNCCKKLLKAETLEERGLQLSSLIYAALSIPFQSNHSKPLLDLVSELHDKELRLHVCLRLISYFAKNRDSRIAVSRLQAIENLFLDPQEKLLFLKARVIQTCKFDRDEALKIVKNASVDDRTKIHLQRLCRIPEKANSTIPEFAFDFTPREQRTPNSGHFRNRVHLRTEEQLQFRLRMFNLPLPTFILPATVREMVQEVHIERERPVEPIQIPHDEVHHRLSPIQPVVASIAGGILRPRPSNIHEETRSILDDVNYEDLYGPPSG